MLIHFVLSTSPFIIFADGYYLAFVNDNLKQYGTAVNITSRILTSPGTDYCLAFWSYFSGRPGMSFDVEQVVDGATVKTTREMSYTSRQWRRHMVDSLPVGTPAPFQVKHYLYTAI